MEITSTRVTRIIADKLGFEVNKLTAEARFNFDLGADSLDVLEIIMELENEFDISISDEASEKIKTVGQAIDYINNAMRVKVQKGS